MKTQPVVLFTIVCLGILLQTSFKKSVVPPSALKEENVTYSAGGVTMHGYVVYDTRYKGKRPGILVVHEWWGLTNYPKMRARQLAKMGYIAMAIDMFGNGKIAKTPAEAQSLTKPFYSDPELEKTRFVAALNKLKQFPQTNDRKLAAIGYCFGGGVVLNCAKLGVDLKGVVSFHGTIVGVKPQKNLLKAKILVCQGADDKFVSHQDEENFKHQLDSIGASYIFKIYPNAMHAFTNPEATMLGKKFNLPIAYNAKAEEESWNEMKKFFAEIFK